MGSLFAPRPEKKIFELVGSRDLAALKGLLARTPNAANTTDPNTGGTPLHAAAYSGWDDGVIALLAAGANPNTPDAGYGAIPLQLAITKGHRAIAAVLIEAGSNLAHRHKNGHTPLMVAIERLQPDLLVVLLEKGGSPKQGIDNLPLVTWACKRWWAMDLDNQKLPTAAATLRLLAENDIPIDPLSQPDGTPLMQAVLAGHLLLVQTLLALGADPDLGNPGTSPRMMAEDMSAHGPSHQQIFELFKDGPSR